MTLNLREVREAHGMTQTTLSKASGISRQTIIALEGNADYNVTAKTLTALADALGIDVQELFLPGACSRLNKDGED